MINCILIAGNIWASQHGYSVNLSLVTDVRRDTGTLIFHMINGKDIRLYTAMTMNEFAVDCNKQADEALMRSVEND